MLKCMLPYELSVAEVAQLRASATPFILLDVREPWEVATASIAGSTDIPMNDIPARANNDLDLDAHIVVMCHHGARSLSVTAWLRREGFDNTQSMAGELNNGPAKLMAPCHGTERDYTSIFENR